MAKLGKVLQNSDVFLKLKYSKNVTWDKDAVAALCIIKY